METSTFLWSCIRVGIVEELMYANEAYGVGDRWFRLCIVFWLCSSGSSPLRMGSATAGWSRPAPSQSGHRWLGTDIAQPGMSDERQKSRPYGCTAFPTSQGSKTSDAERPPSGTTRRHYARNLWDPEHKVLTYVYSGSVVRFTSPCCGRPDPYAQDVSAVCTIKEAKW